MESFMRNLEPYPRVDAVRGESLFATAFELWANKCRTDVDLWLALQPAATNIALGFFLGCGRLSANCAATTSTFLDNT